MKIEYFVENALLSMLKTKPITQIFVSNLIEEVGICKGTFYKYYNDKYDLLRKCFYNAFYRKIMERSETFEQFVGNCLKEFRKASNIVLHAMEYEGFDSLFEYHNHLLADCLVKDRVKAGQETEGLYAEMIHFYARGITKLTCDWLSDPRDRQVEEIMGLIRATVPVGLCMS